ncbi:MAG TPA: ATPase with chaperone activity [Albitalea sp.]|uniref:ATPase with chaperone activity n=1 Tax=Piscinibacter sp. TaxID=1903157 RepID=UPI002ED0240C
MSDEDQTLVPRAFIDIFVPPGAIKPTQPREHIALRHELCEDLAQMLAEQVAAKTLGSGESRNDVVSRIRRGLLSDEAVVSEREAEWVVGRLVELLE